jgi:hypothetical protein
LTPQRKWPGGGLADRNFAAKATQRKGLQSRRSYRELRLELL